MSRATLWRATSSRPGTSVVRITDCSSLSGLATGSTRARTSLSATRSLRTASGVTKLNVTTSLQPRPAQLVLDLPPELLRPRQRSDRAAARRQRRREALQPVHARDLLDQVGLAVDVVVAEVRHLRLEVAVAPLHAEAEALEDRLGLLGRDRLARAARRAARRAA